MKQRVRENPVVRRARIVDEAIRIVGERGYNGFTVQALAERCGLTNAGLLHYFVSKDALLIALLDEIERREIDAIVPVIHPVLSHIEAGTATPADIFRALRHIGTNVAHSPELGRFLTVLHAESLNPDHPAHDWFELVEHETRSLFVQLAACLVADPQVKAAQLLAAMRGLHLQWFRSDCQFDLGTAWATLIEALLPMQPIEKTAINQGENFHA
jgi:AcrR family transcriptional regulator